MRLRLESILEGGKTISEEIDPAAMQLDQPCYSFEEPLTLTGRATRSGEDIYVTGNLMGAVKCQCGRCLGMFTMPLDVVLDAVFVPQEESMEDDNEMFEPESNLSYYDGDSIDLLEEIRDLLLVNLPIKPICRSACRGLCPQCGTDLNKDSCHCENRKGPSPFDKLKELKQKL